MHLWCPKWDSNPQNHDFESRKYTSSIIRAKLIGIGFSHSGAPISFSQPFSLVSLANCGLKRRVIHKPAAASRVVSGTLSMALPRKYWGFNLYSAVPVPTQSSAVLVGRVGVEPTTLKRTDLQSAAFADSLPTHIIAPILWRDRRHRRFFLFLKGVLVYALIHQWWTLWKSNPPEYPPCKGGDHPMQSQGPFI